MSIDFRLQGKKLTGLKYKNVLVCNAYSIVMEAVCLEIDSLV